MLNEFVETLVLSCAEVVELDEMSEVEVVVFLTLEQLETTKVSC